MCDVKEIENIKADIRELKQEIKTIKEEQTKKKTYDKVHAEKIEKVSEEIVKLQVQLAEWSAKNDNQELFNQIMTLFTEQTHENQKQTKQLFTVFCIVIVALISIVAPNIQVILNAFK